MLTEFVFIFHRRIPKNTYTLIILLEISPCWDNKTTLIFSGAIGQHHTGIQEQHFRYVEPLLEMQPFTSRIMPRSPKTQPQAVRSDRVLTTFIAGNMSTIHQCGQKTLFMGHARSDVSPSALFDASSFGSFARSNQLGQANIQRLAESPPMFIMFNQRVTILLGFKQFEQGVYYLAPLTMITLCRHIDNQHILTR